MVSLLRRLTLGGLVCCALIAPVAAQASGSGYFCNQDSSGHYYTPYSDCQGGTARVLTSVYIYSPTTRGCASYATYNGEPFSTSRDYNCGTGEWYGIYLPYNTLAWYPLNHMSSQTGQAVGYYSWR